MKINIYDPGLLDYAGHHADINFRIARELKRRGVGVAIFANKRFKNKTQEFHVRSVFETCPYSIIKSYQDNSTDTTNSVFNADSMEIGGVIQQSEYADHSIFPTMFASQAKALEYVTKDLGKITGILQMAPTMENPHGCIYYKEAFRALCKKPEKVTLGVIEEELLLDYDALLESDKIRVKILPIPYDRGAIKRSLNGRLRIGLLGHHKNVKGLRNLDLLLSTLVAKGYEVLIHDSTGRIKATGGSDKVKVYAYVDDLSELISECDLVILNYDQKHYRDHGSGIFYQCLANAVPVMVPRGTTMSLALSRQRLGGSFVAGSLGSLLTNVDSFAHNYDRNKMKYIEASEVYSKNNSTRHLVDTILNESGEE